MVDRKIQKRLNLSDKHIISNIHKYGNTTSASIPIALNEALIDQKLKKGDILVLAAFANGDNTSFKTLAVKNGPLPCTILSIEVLPLIASFTFTP